MTRRGRALAAAALAGAAAAVPQASAMDGMSGDEPDVVIAYQAYEPARIAALEGDSVSWQNQSARAHTVTADDGSWGSGQLFSSSTFEHRFESAGTFTYYCTLHTGMRGEVDVYPLLLDQPSGAVVPGQEVTLHGRAALAPGSGVSIEADSGSGFQAVASAAVAGDGSFAARLRPRAGGSYRAVADGAASPAVQLRVEDRRVLAAVSRHGRDAAVSVRVTPSSPGATVVLQVASREHFGWWPTRRSRLDRGSRARFTLHTRRRLRMRVLLTRRDGATVLARSSVLRLRAARR